MPNTSERKAQRLIRLKIQANKLLDKLVITQDAEQHALLKDRYIDIANSIELLEAEEYYNSLKKKLQNLEPGVPVNINIPLKRFSLKSGE